MSSCTRSSSRRTNSKTAPQTLIPPLTPLPQHNNKKKSPGSCERKFWDSGEYFLTREGLAHALDGMPFEGSLQQLEQLPKLY